MFRGVASHPIAFLTRTVRPRALARFVPPGRLALSGRLAGSPRVRVLRLLWETSPLLTLMMGLFVLADGFLPWWPWWLWAGPPDASRRR